MAIIGQDNLISKLYSFTLDTLPRTCMVEGPTGSGRHTIVNMLASNLNLEVLDITENLNLDYITQMLLKSTPGAYIIDGNALTVKNENTILKLLEEPLKNTFIFLIVDDKNALLDTIKNRCYSLKMDPYNKETLATFLNHEVEDRDLILSLAKTPGDVMSMQAHPMRDMVELCNKIFDKIVVANYANTLSLSNQIAFKDEKDKFNFNLFFRVLLDTARNRVHHTNNYYEYFITNDFYNKLSVKNIDKRHLFDNYLLVLKEHASQSQGVSNN